MLLMHEESVGVVIDLVWLAIQRLSTILSIAYYDCRCLIVDLTLRYHWCHLLVCLQRHLLFQRARILR